MAQPAILIYSKIFYFEIRHIFVVHHIGLFRACGQVNQLDTDWLVNPAPFKAKVTEDKASHELVLENGLARRVIRLAPNAATIDMQNLITGEHMLRTVAPEARVAIDGIPYTNKERGNEGVTAVQNNQRSSKWEHFKH